MYERLLYMSENDAKCPPALPSCCSGISVAFICPFYFTAASHSSFMLAGSILSFSSSPYIHVGFQWVLQFSPPAKNMSRGEGYAKQPLGVNACVCMVHQSGISSRVYSHLTPSVPSKLRARSALLYFYNLPLLCRHQNIFISSPSCRCLEEFRIVECCTRIQE